MSYILAIDTSVDACSVALATPEGIHQIVEVAPREHTQKLLPAIEALLLQQNVSLAQCDAIAFGVGPGSFTGLRIALSTAQGLAYGAGIPLIPVSTLQTMAQTAIRTGVAKPNQLILPTIDARMKEVYWCAYRYNDDKQLVEAMDKEQLCAPEQLAEHALITADIAAVGSGWQYDALASRLSALSVSAVQDSYPEAYDLAFLAQDMFARQGAAVTVDPLNAIPTYIRDEVSWKKRQRIREPQS